MIDLTKFFVMALDATAKPSAMDKAAEMKNAKVFNMIVLGGLLKVCPVVSTDGLKKALFKSLPERHHNLIPLNMQAVEEGMKIISNSKLE